MTIKHYPKTEQVTIPNGASVPTGTNAADIRYRMLVGVVVPSGWTAAGLGFLVSYDGGTTFVQLRVTDGAVRPFGLDELEIEDADIPTNEAVMIALDPAWFLGCTHVQPKSQTDGLAVNQTGDKVLTFVTRDVESA